MVVVDRSFTGSAAQATLMTAMTPSSPTGGGTITVSDDSGYPTSGKFEIVIDRATESEENVLISSRAGTTFTISQRGYDGSVARTHTSGVALVEHDLSGRTVQLFVDHVDDVESDPHSTKLLNNTRHDLEARHTFGAAYGTPVTPTALTPDIAGAAGTGNNPSREDHVHNVPAAVAGNISPDDVAAEGAAASFARSDHTHGITAAVANTITPDASPAEGAATSFSRSDHTHGIAAATAVSVGTANAEGVSTSFARADHTHDLVAAAVGTTELVDDAVTQAKLALNYVAGIHNDNLTSAAAEVSTFTYGVTFASAPTVVGTVYQDDFFDLVLNWDTIPTTTGVQFRVATRNGGTATGNYSIHWVAIGVLA